MTKGILEQIKENAEVFDGRPPTEKELRGFFERVSREHEAYVEHLSKLESEWATHWKAKKIEHGEDPPLWLVLLTAPSNNLLNHGTFMTSGEFVEKHKKWLV